MNVNAQMESVESNARLMIAPVDLVRMTVHLCMWLYLENISSLTCQFPSNFGYFVLFDNYILECWFSPVVMATQCFHFFRLYISEFWFSPVVMTTQYFNFFRLERKMYYQKMDLASFFVKIKIVEFRTVIFSLGYNN